MISDKTPWHELSQQGVGFDLPLTDKRVFAQTVDLIARLDVASFEKMCLAAYHYTQSVCHNPVIKEKYISLFG